MLKASRGDMLFAVDDDPDGACDGTAVLATDPAKPQVGAFASTRHNSLMRSMLAKVV
jgi:hypothetical protein